MHGIAHITGGGLKENIQRILPSHCRVHIDTASWQTPPVFSWLQQLGQVETDEMFRVFNMGIGMVLIVSPYYADTVLRTMKRHEIGSRVIGRVTAGGGQVELVPV